MSPTILLRLLLFRRFAAAAALFAATWGVPAIGTATAEPVVAIDWEKFLSRHDLVWTSPPQTWDDGAFLGNGLLGAMVYSDSPREIGWTIGRTDVTDHQSGPDPMVRQPRLPIGRLVLNTAGSIVGGDARLDLWNAEARGVVRTDRGEIRWRKLVHADDLVVLILLETTEGESAARWTWHPATAVNPRKLYRKFPLGNQDINPAPYVEEYGATRVSVQSLGAGGGYATAWREQQLPSNTRALYLSVGNSVKSRNAGSEARTAVEIAALLGDGTDAVQYLNSLLKFYIEPNTLYREAGPVLETPIGAANSIQELLLQNWGGTIRVFPAVPKDWQDIVFHNFRTEGAFLVSAVRHGGTSQYVRITSLAGEPCRVKTDIAGELKVQAARSIVPRVVSPGVVELDLRKGETATLYATEVALTIPIQAVPAEPGRTNYFGSHALEDRARTPFKRQTRPQSATQVIKVDPPRTP